MLTRVEISKKSLSNNLISFQQSYPEHTIIPVIKSNAYGVGLKLVVTVIAPLCTQVAVVSTTEALKVRKLMPDHRIIVLSIIEPDDLEDSLMNNIELPAYNLHWLNLIEKTARQHGIRAGIHLKLDLGTHRVGFTPPNSPQAVKRITSSESLTLMGIYSHYAASEEIDQFTTKQTKLFDKTMKTLSHLTKEADNLQVHMACSAASEIGAIPISSNALRIGLSLYGLWPSTSAKAKAPKHLKLEPVLAWITSIIHLQVVQKGNFIGYGCSYQVKKKQKIATLPIGYYDGYHMGLSNKGFVLLDGVRCPIRGRVCMNLLMVDVSSIKNAKIKDQVVLIGQQNNKEITPRELGELAGTINYDIISRINPHIPRILVS